MTRRAIIALAAWAAVMTSGLAVAANRDHAPPIAATPPATTASHCDWHTEYQRTLAELGADPAAWTVVDEEQIDGQGGRTYLDTMEVFISRDLPCRVVGDAVRHEWMHLQQGRAYPGWSALDHWGDRIEYVADCGSWLLGSVSYTPYRDEQREQGIGLGCTPSDLADARALIQEASNSPAT